MIKNDMQIYNQIRKLNTIIRSLVLYNSLQTFFLNANKKVCFFLKSKPLYKAFCIKEKLSTRLRNSKIR